MAEKYENADGSPKTDLQLLIEFATEYEDDFGAFLDSIDIESTETELVIRRAKEDEACINRLCRNISAKLGA